MTYRYTLEGYSSGVLKSKLLDKTWDQNEYADMEFPIEAYRKLCKRLNLPFPLDDGAGTQASEIPQQKPEAPNDLMLIDGLTVADVRAMCERSGALASVLRAVAKWQAIKKENPERMTESALKAQLRAAARKDGWGTNRGEISSNQSELLTKLITDGFQSGGRPRKTSNG